MLRVVISRLLQQQQTTSGRCSLKVGILTREFHITANPLNASSMSDLKSLLSKAKVSAGNKSETHKDELNSHKPFRGKQKDFKKTDFSSNHGWNKEKGKEGGQLSFSNKKYPPKERDNKDKTEFSDRRSKYKHQGPGKGKKGSRGSSKNRNSYDAEEEKRQKRKFLFLETGNDRDKDAAKRIISEAIKENDKGLVQVIKGGGVVEVVNVIDAFEGIVLSEKGIIVVGNRNIKQEDEDKHGLSVGSKMLILKVVERQLAIKQYGDFLSEQVVEKLKLSKSNILDKQKKRKDDGGKGELKVVQVGWNINLNDLTGQKKFEIENHLKKGHDVEIVFDERSYLDKENSGFGGGGSGGAGGGSDSGSAEKMELYSKRRKDLNDVERALRNKMLAIVEDNLRELEGLPESNIVSKKGFIESRMIIRVKGIDRKNDNIREDKREKKRMEKALKAEKIRQRREEKERLARETMKELVL